jgi:hypothetical protein
MLDVFIEQSPERRSFHFGAWNFLVELHQNCLRWGTSWGLRFDWRLCTGQASLQSLFNCDQRHGSRIHPSSIAAHRTCIGLPIT